MELECKTQQIKCISIENKAISSPEEFIATWARHENKSLPSNVWRILSENYAKLVKRQTYERL